MSGYTKLFSSIIASTIWREPDHVRVVWITMLAMADRDGIVAASLPGLADMARKTVAETIEAVKVLESPDSFSRSQEFDGRRIEKVDGGWLILNHAKYRAKMGADERREYNRLAQARYREKQAKASAPAAPPKPAQVLQPTEPAPSQQVSLTVNHNEQCQHIAEAEAEASNNPCAESAAGQAPAGKPPAEELPLGAEAAPAAVKTRTRPRNELLDALAGLGGANLAEVPKSTWAFYRKLLTELQAVCPTLTVEEIHRREQNMRTRWPSIKVTPGTLVKHWANFASVTTEESLVPHNLRPDAHA